MQLSREEYRRRVMGCWMGKNIGGTLGAPFEFIRQVNDVSFYAQDLGGEPLPNDDLDLQLLWLIALEERGLDIDAHTLADYWCLYITPHWSEYGIAKANLRAGLPPPWSGLCDNLWRHSCGAFIRSEIWACIAPGLPDTAVRYAVEDAVVDHADGEGSWGEVFFAAMESAAFVSDDLHALIDIGLSYIPETCGMAAAVRCAVNAHASGMNWRDARDEILKHHRGATLFNLPERTSAADRAKGFDKGVLGYDAPSNVALAVLALLVGGDDFGRVVTTAVNCGEDTDCTAATAGALFGLLHGIDAIPDQWIKPIGRRIKTMCLNLGELGAFGGQVPQTVDDLTDRTERMSRQVLARFGGNRKTNPLPGEKPTDVSLVEALKAPESLRRDLAARVAAARYRFDFFDVDVRPDGGPTLREGQPKVVRLTIHNRYKVQAPMLLRWHVPDGWRVEPGRAAAVMSLPAILGGPTTVAVTLHPGELTGSVVRCVAELSIDGRPATMLVPVVLRNGNLAGDAGITPQTAS
ncbi:MAG TPA: ADP-ribosylglycohydrolase family protein [Phycisphaerae bacterium]|nr:ADP-ribosylglycohydrolase family protein [Phycisphaerae bacterium]